MSAATLTRQRCWVHLEREAAARCPVCSHFYCRECVTEHDGRVICAPCLRSLLAAAEARRAGLAAGTRRVFAAAARAGQLVFCLALTWYFFHALGQWAMSGGAEFHEGNVWKQQLFGGGSEPGSDDKDSDKNSPSDNPEGDPGEDR